MQMVLGFASLGCLDVKVLRAPQGHPEETADDGGKRYTNQDVINRRRALTGGDGFGGKTRRNVDRVEIYASLGHASFNAVQR